MMISDGETKGSSPRNEETHSFPLLNNSPLGDKKGSSKGRCDSFRPLFNNAHVGGTLSTHKGLGAPNPDGSRNSEDQVRRQGFQRGFDAGKKDACSLVRQKTAPQIKSFVDAFSQWNEMMIRIEEDSSSHILKMAVSIAEKILGHSPKCCTGGLDMLKVVLRERMRRAYHIEFNLNFDEMNALSELLACENVHWEWDYITATGDTEVQNGSLLVQAGTQTIVADDGILLSLEASLSEVSTK